MTKRTVQRKDNLCETELRIDVYVRWRLFSQDNCNVKGMKGEAWYIFPLQLNFITYIAAVTGGAANKP